MSRQEFLQRLRQALTGQVSESVIAENITYYDDYISNEVQKGLIEESVINEIGDPRLIAKTIIDASEGGSKSAYETYQKKSTVFENDQESKDDNIYINLNKWYWKLLAAAAFLLIISVIFLVISGLLAIVIPLLGPIFLILFIVWMIKRIK